MATGRETMRRVGPTLAAGLLAWLVAAWPALAQGGPPPARVRVDEARMEPVDQLRRVTGELRAPQRSRVAGEEPGLVLELTVEPGDRVEGGAVLARLDARLLELEADRLDSDRASKAALLEVRRGELEQVERDLERLQELRDQGGATQTEVDDARTDVRTARARIAEAEAELAAAEAALENVRERIANTVIRAPFDGYVFAKSLEVGEWMREGEVLVELVALDPIDAYMDVPEQFIGAVSPGGLVEVRLEATGETAAARVEAVLPEGDRLARTFPVRLTMDNPEGRLRPGMSVVALVPTGATARALTVHKDAVLRDDAGTFVYANMGGSAAPIRVEPLYGVGDRLVIREGRLRPDTELVIEGNERMFPGQPLLIPGRESAARGGGPGGEGGEDSGERRGG